MEHDGAIDDLLSQLLVLTMQHKELIGINVTPADCYIEPALESTFKALHLFGREDIAIGRSDHNGVNAFPGEWRARPEIMNVLPLMINLPKPPDPYSYPEAAQLLTDKLLQADSPVTIIITGPCSNVVNALRKMPLLKEKIKEIVWMAGAFTTHGNVQTYQHNGTAEWNVYWDPKSAKELFEMNLPLVCIPLNVTNQVPVTREFLSTLANQANYKISNLAGQFWALTIDTIPGYYYTYFMWDLLATSYLAIPHEFTLETVKAIISDRPPNAGQTLIHPQGYVVKIATGVNKQAFYTYILEQFKSR